MAEMPKRVRVEEVDWHGMLPFLHLFRSFAMAIHPAKLAVSLMLVVLLYLGGKFIDAALGPSVYTEEFEAYITSTPDEFKAWQEGREEWIRNQLFRIVGSVTQAEIGESTPRGPERFQRAIDRLTQHYNTRRDVLMEMQKDATGDSGGIIRRRIEEVEQERRSRVAQVLNVQPRGVFESGLQYEVRAFERLIRAAISLEFGFDSLLQGGGADRATVAGALREMVVSIPMWGLRCHTGFFFLYLAVAIGVWSLLGGAVARMSALHATRDIRIGPTQAVRFSFSFWPWFVLSPLIMPIVAGAACLGLFLFGVLLMGIPKVQLATEPIGGLLFGVALLLGLVVSLFFIGVLLSFGLLYPAVAVEGTDGFDANSRAMSYVIGRPWHLLFYNAAALVYGAVTYLFVGAVVFLTLAVTHTFVGLGASVFTGRTRFDAVLPPPQIGKLAYRMDWNQLDTPGKIAAVLTLAWVYIFVGLLAAYAVSYFFTSQTWIYLLLRRNADGTGFDDVHLVTAAGDEEGSDDAQAPQPAPPDKVEPAPPPTETPVN